MRWRSPGMLLAAALSVAAAAGLTIGVLVFAPGAGRQLPPARACAYENVDACLLTGPSGVAGSAAQVWAGMEDASRATTARVSYLAVTGPATVANATPYLGSLLVRGCRVIVAAGAPERAAALADAPRYPKIRFVVTGTAPARANVTAVAFAPSGMRAAVASAVESGVRGAGGPCGFPVAPPAPI